MKTALPVGSVLALNEGKFRREQDYFFQAEGSVYATTSFEAGSTDALHYHEEPHLSLLLNGGMIDKRKSYEAEVSCGDLIFFRQGEEHQSIFRSFPITVVTVELENWFSDENQTIDSLSDRSIQNDLQAKFVMLKIYKELLVKDEFSASTIESLLLKLLDDRRSLNTARPAWANTIKDLLNDSWSEPLTLSDLANAVNVHPTTISKHFPRFFSCTIGEYRRRLKVEKAIRRIKGSKMSLTEIAHDCGFSDHSHFTRSFKQITGFLPSHYRSL